MIEIIVKGTEIYGKLDTKLTSGSVGRMIKFIFDADWDGLAKTAVFKVGTEYKNWYLGVDGDECEFPAELLTHDKVGQAVSIGVCGMRETVLVYPTVYTYIGELAQGADVSGNSTIPLTPELAQQLINIAEESKQIAAESKEVAQSVRDDADNGMFDGDAAHTDQVFDPESEHAQSGIALDGLVAKELTEDTGLQNMEAGIYTAKPASGTNVKVQLGEGLTKLTLREGATLIVGGDTTIKTHSSISFQPFKKTFLVIGQQTTHMANYVKAGEVICKFVLDAESESSHYEYEVKQGNVLTTDDRTMNIDSEGTAISNIPSVGAVKKYVNEHGGARVLNADMDAYVGDLETGVYTINGVEADTGCCLWFDDYGDIGMLNGIAIITKDDEEVYEWMFVGLDQGYNTVSKKGTTYFDTEEECWTISTQGEVETKDNQVNDLNEPNYWTYPTTKAVVDYINNNLTYTKGYHYDITNLKDYKIDYSITAFLTRFDTGSRYVSGNGTSTPYPTLDLTMYLFTHKNGKPIVETPLEVWQKNPSSSYKYKDYEVLVDAEFSINGNPTTFSELKESYYDPEYVEEIELFPTTYEAGEYLGIGMCLEMIFKPGMEKVVQDYYNEFNPAVQNMDNSFTLYIENRPNPIVECEVYVGGD